MNSLNGVPPVLVAHRGYSGRYPENTLLSYKAAYKAGARYMELDLQMTRDRVPFLHHDKTLKRMAGVALDIRDIKASQVKSYHASYPKRFDSQFSDNKFTTFKKFCKWLKTKPDVIIFVEIKQQSIDRFGIPVFVDEVYKRIAECKVASQCVVISFNQEVVDYTRKISDLKTGWVLPKWSTKNRAIADQLQPDYLFCDKNFLPNKETKRWQGGWQWVVYNLDDVESAIAMANRGYKLLETNEIGDLMASPDFTS